MQAGFAELLLWSFLLATGHGAGLMLLPVLLHSPDHSAHSGHASLATSDPVNVVTATLVHSAATLITTGLIAILVYEWIGLAFLRRGWINMDWIWSGALVTTGVLLVITTWIRL